MPQYAWKGITRTGEQRKGTLAADSRYDLQEQLLKQHIALLSWKNKTQWSIPFIKLTSYKVVSPEQIALFFEHLSMLLQCNIPIITALQLSQQYVQSARLKKILKRITKKVQQGDALSIATSEYPQYFTPLMISIISSGEQSGSLTEVLTQIAQYLNIQLSLTKKLKNAALLPLITLIFSLAIITGIFLFIIPQLESIFHSTQHELPASTKIILSVSKALQNEQWIAGILLGIVLLIAAIRFLLKTPWFSNFIDRAVLHIPFIKQLVISKSLLTYTNTLALLLRSGNTLQDSLKSASDSISNSILRKETATIITSINKGNSLETAFRNIQHSHMPETLLSAIAIGEQGENLVIMLEKTAFF